MFEDEDDDGMPRGFPIPPEVVKAILKKHGVNTEPRIPDVMVQIEEKDIEKIYTAYDAYQAISHRGDHLARYKFWKLVYELYPQAEGNECSLNINKPCAPFIEIFFTTNEKKENT